MHKFFHINKYFCLGFITIAALGTQIVHANDEMFQNNLMRMDVHKTSLGGVKVTLYTTKPYKDAVVVNKKSDQEYIILMPETASTLTSKPALNSTSDVLTKIDVKTQQYGATQGQKGYTKIIITTLRPIEITPQVETLSVAKYKLSETETKELLAQAGKKQVSAPQKASKTPVKQATKTAVKPQQAQKISQKTATASAKATTSPSRKVTKQVLKQKPTQKVTKKVTQAPQKIVKPVKVAEPKIIKPVETQEATTPVAVQTPTEEKQATVQEPTVKTPVTEPIATPITPPVQPNIEKYGKFQKYVNLLSTVDNTTLLAAGAIPAIIILLLLIAIRKKKDKASANQFKKVQSATTEVTPSAETYIDETLDWKEKFNAYKNQPETTPVEENMFDEDQLEESQFAENPFDDETPIQYGMEEEEEQALDIEDLFAPKDLGGFSTTMAEVEEAQQEEADDTSWGDFAAEEVGQESSIDDLFEGEDFAEELTDETQAGLDEDDQEDFSDDFNFEQAFENIEEEEQQAIEPYFEDHQLEIAIEEPKLDPQQEVLASLGLASKSAFQIDETKGFLLIDFEGTTALVGYINEEIFVLKRFDEPTQGKLQARLNEHKGNSATYIARVGNFKALIEVTPEKMNFLLEL